MLSIEEVCNFIINTTCLGTGQLAADRPLLGRDARLGLPLLPVVLHKEPLVRLGRIVRGQVCRDQKKLGVEGQLDVEAAVLLLHHLQRFQVFSPLNFLQLSAGCLLKMKCRQRLLEVFLDSSVRKEIYESLALFAVSVISKPQPSPVESSHIVLLDVASDDGVPKGGVVPLTKVLQLGESTAGLDEHRDDDARVVQEKLRV